MQGEAEEEVQGRTGQWFEVTSSSGSVAVAVAVVVAVTVVVAVIEQW